MCPEKKRWDSGTAGQRDRTPCPGDDRRIQTIQIPVSHLFVAITNFVLHCLIFFSKFAGQRQNDAVTPINSVGYVVLSWFRTNQDKADKKTLGTRSIKDGFQRLAGV